jgi:hypothetical protein
VNVKELPRRVKKLPVVKAVFLGWLRDYTPGMAGYFCAVITHDKGAPDGAAFNTHMLWAPGLDKPWSEHQTWGNQSSGQADQAFIALEKLAEWPETEKK